MMKSVLVAIICALVLVLAVACAGTPPAADPVVVEVEEAYTYYDAEADAYGYDLDE